LQRPDRATVNRILKSACVLTSTGRFSSGFNTDHNRALLGSDCFAEACAALRAWKMFELGWVEICWPEAPIAVGTVVAPLIRHLGFWSINPARVIAIVDEPRRFGFTYATLEGHAECGEEQFLVEWLENGEVWYDIYAVSRPKHWLAWAGYPVVRAFQLKFAQDSLRAMRKAVGETRD
jgi:uncharacterized protein (UPF0548 family)